MSVMTFSNYLTMGLTAYYQPEANDWYESRVQGRKFNEPGFTWFRAFVSSDYRKKLAFDAQLIVKNSFDYNSEYYSLSIGPRLRINDRLFVNYNINESYYSNRPGYVTQEDNSADSIVFGRRDMNTLINTLNANYSFTNRSSLSFRVRHYWSFYDYDKYYLLNENGTLNDFNSFQGSARNFNTFNVDMVYSWFFAPGSELSIVWKNAIEADEDYIVNRFSDNFKNTLESPQLNSISIKLLYYLDYQKLKEKLPG